MAIRLSPLPQLKGAQLGASNPEDLVWLSASAGTGKTQVLTARVLRLLLTGVAPETILCLTFTKAGAAEMADRIHARLAAWVRMEDARLRKELFALGEPNDDDAINAARSLFARVLDAPGGGLRIQTIHAFCQTLLAGFPAEAGLAPGFRPIEGREEAALARSTLATLLTDAERQGDLGLIADMQALSLRLGEEAVQAYLRRCARDAETMAALGPRQAIAARLRRALDVPLGDVEEVIAAACADDALDPALRAIGAANRAWGTKTALADGDTITTFLAALPEQRAGMLEAVLGVAWTKAGEPRKYSQKLIDAELEYAGLCARLAEQCAALLGLRARAALADLLAAGLRAGQSYAQAYAEAKRRAGLVDFDDLIRIAVRLLETDGMGDWVRYKLDQATDHILVDEAQDTNARQWAIVAALAGEYFAGEGARSSRRHRTIFTVGDFKQAIFGFQGTDPQAFMAARLAFSMRAEQVGRAFEQLSLDRSFRSSPPILELVDRLIAELGEEALGLDVGEAEPHRSARAHLPGQVTLWRPVIAQASEGDDEGEEGWVDDATRALAARIARQIRQWIDARLWIAARGRPLRPEDILILVRKRGDLASLIVARLHEEGVPVAGVDRLRLNAPLAVRDLLAAIRFVLQPEDDLTLASLLVSPLFGWSQEALYRTGFGRRGSLWRAVRDAPEHGATAAALRDLLAQADFITPHQFLETVLSGPLQGRRCLLARLGEEARDPIEELVNAALAFEREATPSLQRFLDWFDRGEVEITRDPAAPLDAVRVMTVHGAKGLQAPLVILADATADPEAARAHAIDWALDEDVGSVPVFRPRKAELDGGLAEAVAAAQRREAAEHWRLLYVALTRAEERLVIGGALGPRARGEPPAQSWYQAIDRAMAGLDAALVEDSEWGGARHFHGSNPVQAEKALARPRSAPPILSEPDWLRRPAPIEARPPRPLAPSAIGNDSVSDPPPGPAMQEAARRGRLLHALFERLPAVAPDRRHVSAVRWLTGAAGVADADLAEALAKQACAILDDPAFRDLFAPESLAEAPIAAVVGAEVIAGTVDRLLVRDDRVQLIDYKTGRRVPGTIDAVPIHHLTQMAAYVAALETIFPDRPISAALLYTSGPRLFDLPPDLLARHKPGFQGQE